MISFTQSIEQGELSTSQRRGIITRIHKGKDTAREDIVKLFRKWPKGRNRVG